MKGLFNYARLANRILNTPLMVDPGKLQVIMLALSGRLGFTEDQVQVWDTNAAVFDRDAQPEVKPTMIGKTAVIPISGTLVHRSSFMDAASGLMSYQTIAANFIAALENPAVDSILFDVDSFGGEVSGCFDLADFIFSQRGQKPIWAISNEACYSAAYCLASAADKVVLAETAGVGSVGVYAQHVDFSKANEAAGVVITPIFAGARKNDGNPDFPLSDEAKSWMQAEVDRKYKLFVDTVARNRGITPESVRSTDAGLLFGPNAVKMGIADAVMTFDQAVMELQDSTSFPQRPGGQIPKMEGRDMKLFAGMGKEKAEAPETEQDPAPVVEAAPEQEPVKEDAPVEDAPLAAAEVAKLALEANASAMLPTLLASPITLKLLTERLDVSKKIRELCATAKLPNEADGFITAGLTVTQVQEKLISALASRTEKADVSTKPDPKTAAAEVTEGMSDARKTVIADAERRNKEFHESQEKARRK